MEKNTQGMIPYQAVQVTNSLNLSPDEMQEVMTETRQMMAMMAGYQDLRMMYGCALQTIRTRFEVLDAEFNARAQRNPVHSISTRVKSSRSIIGKMRRLGLPFTVENMEKSILDIAGIRIICSYVDDIYALADALLRQDDITLIARKDYIANPKPNGYRSLHLIIHLPVYFADQRKDIPVEVQIRTIAMDFWASLEHQMKYKQQIADPESIIARLTACAEQSAALDQEMLAIRQCIDAGKDKLTEEDMLLRQLQRIELSSSQR